MYTGITMYYIQKACMIITVIKYIIYGAILHIVYDKFRTNITIHYYNNSIKMQ